MLSRIYRWFVQGKQQDEVTVDMIQTFEDARAGAKARGWWSYSVFAIREVFGLLALHGAPRPNRRWTPVAAWGLAGLAVGALVAYLMPAQYTSEANLRIAPPLIADELTQRDKVDVDNTLDRLLPMIFSEAVLTTIVNTYDLYRDERESRPMELLVAEMRKAIRIDRGGPFVIRVAFTYTDPLVSQRVTQALLTRLIDENLRTRSNQVYQTVQLFQDLSDAAAKRWEKLNAQLHGLTPADSQFDRLSSDRDQARREYESLRQKVSDARVMEVLSERRQGTVMELLDPASLPVAPDASPWSTVLIGLAAGLGTGLIIVLWRALRRPPHELAAEPAA